MFRGRRLRQRSGAIENSENIPVKEIPHFRLRRTSKVRHGFSHLRTSTKNPMQKVRTAISDKSTGFDITSTTRKIKQKDGADSRISKELVIRLHRCDGHRTQQIITPTIADTRISKEIRITLVRCDARTQKHISSAKVSPDEASSADRVKGIRVQKALCDGVDCMCFNAHEEAEHRFAGEDLTEEDDSQESKFCSIAPIEMEMNDEDKLEVLANAMDLDEDQDKRFQCYLRSGLNFKTTRSLIQCISKHAVDDVCVWAVCDLTKGFVEDVVNGALDFEESCGWTGPITPEAILAASFKLKMEENLRINSHKKTRG